MCIMEGMISLARPGDLSDFAIFKAKIAVMLNAMRVLGSGRTVWLSCLALALTACDRSPRTTDRAGERSYEARGIIREMAPDGRTVEVEHEDIRGFMPSMTMPFSVHDSKEMAGLHMGDAIAFCLRVNDNDSFIDRIRKISMTEVHLPAPSATPGERSVSQNAPRLREGDMMPVFQLVDQDGRKIGLETFRGHPFVLTFIFTRCPIPNFCPRMSKNFLELQDAIRKQTGLIAQTRLLSVSFDPEFDSPQVLKAYAEHAQADQNIWTLATGEKSEVNDLTHGFSVYVQAEGGTLAHGLATALIDADGTIRKIWRGNGWTPADVIGEVNGHAR